MFLSKNEPDCFSYEDCVISEYRMAEDGICFTVDALIVEPKNSQNTNFTRSYADTAEIRFVGGTIIKAVKEGFRRYDANDRLLEEIPDCPVDEEALGALLSGISGQYLYDLRSVGESDGEKDLVLGIEMATEDLTGADADSYQLLIRCTEFTVAWKRYLNRV